MVGAVVTGVGLAVVFALLAFQNNIVYFVTPTQVATNEIPEGDTYRIGGMVVDGSVKKEGVDVEFELTDTLNIVKVKYNGILPDLFREGQGIVANGRVDRDARVFNAFEVLAKHDENYMPPEAMEAMEAAKNARQSDMVDQFRKSAENAAAKAQSGS